jgi:hypothetical protein
MMGASSHGSSGGTPPGSSVSRPVRREVRRQVERVMGPLETDNDMRDQKIEGLQAQATHSASRIKAIEAKNRRRDEEVTISS